MTYVYGDITPFYDRWGKRHTRLIAKGIWIFAAIKAWWWVQCHPHGSAFLIDRILEESELNQ